MFVEKTDFYSQIYQETLDTIIRNQENIIATEVDKAMKLIESYLSPRYDVAAIFSAVGTSRNSMIVAFVIDIALYNIHCIHDPVMIPEIRVKRYDDVLKRLNEIKKQQMQPDLPTAHTSKPETNYIQYGSNPKRNNSF